MATLTSQNPYTGEINGTVETYTNEQLDEIIDQAHTTYLSWKETSFDERKELFLKMADYMDENREDIAALTTMEMWMLQHVSQNILKGTANLIRWYANNAERILCDEEFAHDWMTGKYRYDSLGVIYGIAPWNFPYNQVLRAAVANIMAGNTTVYKHASNVPLCAAKIEALFDKAWFPKGVYTNIYVSGSQSEHIIANNKVQWVNITASETAGSIIGGLAWKYLKPSVLELWWNDSFVLIDHENTDEMAAQAVACRISMGGQRCNSSKRFIVLEKHYDAFVDAMWRHMANMKTGDPLDIATNLPPIATKKLLADIADQVERSVQSWARLVTWGEIIDGKFFAWTVLADVTLDMASAKEEVFGPVASIIKSSSVEESIVLANSWDFGLSAVVFGDDMDECKAVADRLECGMVFINNPAWSKASLPFGWIKKSGYGKENGPEWLKAFTNKKAIVYTVN